ncbi:MAG TPA: trypsin-like peptidase domain-containing protein [Candidatus Dormibacteraeota bacterium]
MGRTQADHLALALVIGLILVSLAVVVPTAAQRLRPSTPAPTPSPTATPTAPPAAVLIPEELDRALQGVVTLVDDGTFGTAFQIDPRGDFLTAASLVRGSHALRLVDNTGGSHPVRVIGIDDAIGLAEVRADAGGLAMPFGDSESLQVGDPLLLLASKKVANLRTATSMVVAAPVSRATIGVRGDDLPGDTGGPLVGPGGKAVGLFLRNGFALPIAAAKADILAWHDQPGTLLPLAPLPPSLVLRGTDETSTPAAGPSLQSIVPSRASSAQDLVLTLQGNGFVGGPSLAVRFIPVASPTGAFAGLKPSVLNPSTLSVKVPSGQVVQDYVIEVTNGDGATVSSHMAFTVTP